MSVIPAVLGESQLRKIDDVEDLDTTSIIDVHERLILAATE